jgi:two-component system response regulator YesN
MTDLARIKTTIKRYLNITACFGVDGVCPEITEVHQYFQKGEKLLRKKFFEGKDQIYSAPFIQEDGSNFQVLEIKDEKKILDLIKTFKLDELKNYLAEIFAKIQRSHPNSSSLKMTLVTLVNLANKIARDSAIQTATVYGEIADPFAQLEKFDTLEEVRDWILEIYERLIGVLKLYFLNAEYDELTKKAIEYIFKNYQRDLSLDTIADHIGVNSSYLSRKFKKDCGKGVIEYLNGIRIEQAKLLMEQGTMKVKEIAMEVGFNNYNYFFKVFKDNLGMTPLEYEKQRRG